MPCPILYDTLRQHLSVPPPERCPQCLSSSMLRSLGYYRRYVTQICGRSLSILIRRFLCHHCSRSVSCLPDFAQPYHLLHNGVIDDYFHGRRATPGVQGNLQLLGSYFRRFAAHLSVLAVIVGSFFTRPLPVHDPAAALGILLAQGGSVRALSHSLLTRFGVTLFGKYRCHQRF